MGTQTILPILLLAFLPVTTCITVDELQNTINILQKELMQRQIYLEARTRTDGDSGVNRVRVNKVNSRPYHTATFAEDSFLGMHDHAHSKHNIGLGEFTAVLNGIEFSIPHTDYEVENPHTKNSDYLNTQYIGNPKVPPSVEAKATIEEQVEEMKVYFKAWATQNYTLRDDYHKYFKPLICYLEGWWEKDSTQSEAWEQERARFGVYSGSPNKHEDVHFLPRTFLNSEDTAEFAQWKYRVLCHKMQRKYVGKFRLERDQLRLIDDLSTRMSLGLSYKELYESHAARFEINPENPDGDWSDDSRGYSFMDKIMGYLPGLDNYVAVDLPPVPDTECGKTMKHPVLDETLNTALYHRFVRDPDTNEVRMRAFSDRAVYFARNTRDEVANVSTNTCACSDSNQCPGEVTEKWSFAIPIEIIFQTPLNRWNPYNIDDKGKATSKNGKTVTENGRNGGFETSTAFNGTNRDVFYRTPSEFFKDQNIKVGVLDQSGVVRNVSQSGYNILFPEIEGLGKLRQRFPLAPVHGEGNYAWKVYDALQEMLMRPFKNTNMFYDEWNPTTDASNDGQPITPLASGVNATLQLTLSNYDGNGHQHDVFIAETQVDSLIAGDLVTVTSSLSKYHTHDLLLEYHGNDDTAWIEVIKCGTQDFCPDGHKSHLIPIVTA